MRKSIFLTVISLVCLMGSQVKAQMPAVATDVSPMMVGETIPDAMLVDAQGRSVSLYSLIKEKPTIIVFYRGVWCSNCIRNFKEEYNPNLPEIEKLGYNLVTICPDAPQSLLKTSSDAGMDSKYFFGDGTGALAKPMGLAFQQQERMKDRLLESSDGKNTELYLPIPAVYIIDTNQEIIFADLRPSAVSWEKRMKWKLLGAVLQALK